MKKLIAIVVMSVITFFIGCKSIPTDEQMYKSATAIGTAAGLVCNMTTIDDTSRNVIIDIVNKVDKCIPQTNQTFEVAWTPIAQEHVNKLIADGKINQKQGKLIMSAFGTVTKGIDYLFDIRFPKVRMYANLVESAVHGFTTGFLLTFKPANAFEVATKETPVDSEAYEFLLAEKNLRK